VHAASHEPPPPVAVVAACVKWVDLRPEIDQVHGHLVPSTRDGGFSPADEAALEVALRLAERWQAKCALVCAGPRAAEAALAALGAAGADHVVLIGHSNEQESSLAADVLAPVLGPGDLGADVVVCGDLSHDRGSGAVPALLAHHLHASQALGLLEIDAIDAGRVRAVRRLDGGRRELLDVVAPAVLSVEGAAAALRRASLGSTLTAADDPVVEHRHGRIEGHVEPPRLRPWRPRARVLPAPAGTAAFERVLALTGASIERTPPRTVVVGPQEAAELIVEQLTAWGYLAPPTGRADSADPGPDPNGPTDPGAPS
jgi:electron transfer flavoprotein beta subunit